MNKELKQYLYTLVGKELTYEDKEKVLMYFDKLHQENIRLKHKNKRLNNIINELEKWVIIDYDKLNKKELLGTIIGQKLKIERLTELCNKYEEEHKTTFETWQKDIKENKLLHSIIKEVREYIYNKEINTLHFNSKDFLDTSIAGELLEILDKVEEKK